MLTKHAELRRTREIYWNELCEQHPGDDVLHHLYFTGYC